MACWNRELVTMLRVLIWDLSQTPKYADDRLEQVLVTAAQIVKKDCQFSNYNVSISNVVISPDPVNSDPRDDAFINFVVLKAACIADQSTYRTEAFKEGIRILAGPTSLGVSGHAKAFQTLLELGPCKTYEDMKTTYLFGDAVPIKAILSPFTSNNFNPWSLGYYNTTSMGGDFYNNEFRGDPRWPIL